MTQLTLTPRGKAGKAPPERANSRISGTSPPVANTPSSGHPTHAASTLTDNGRIGGARREGGSGVSGVMSSGSALGATHAQSRAEQSLGRGALGATEASSPSGAVASVGVDGVTQSYGVTSGVAVERSELGGAVDARVEGKTEREGGGEDVDDDEFERVDEEWGPGLEGGKEYDRDVEIDSDLDDDLE